MAAASVVGTGTTSGSTLQLVWRKVQGELIQGFQDETEEWKLLQSAKIPKYKINVSAREITTPINIKRATHSAAIPEGGYEAVPVTAALNEVTYTWTNYNHRFSATLTSRYLDRLGQDNQIVRQFKYQTMKAIEGLSDTVGRDFYGFSTGVWAQTTTVATASSGTAYTLANAYGQSGLGNAAFLGAMFQINDRVALVRSGALVTNAIGTVTAVTPATPSITVTWNGSVTSASGDNIVLAMGGENTTLAGTNYNKTINGLLDGLTSTSLHNLSTSSEALWAAGYADTSGGRFSGVRLRKLKQGIRNTGGGELNLLILDQGVGNDLFASQSGALRFTDPTNMPLDGKVTDAGLTIFDSRKVLPGYAIGLDTRNSVKKFSLLDFPGEGDLSFEDGDKMEGQNAMAFSVDFPLAMCWQNRGNAGYLSGLTQQ